VTSGYVEMMSEGVWGMRKFSYSPLRQARSSVGLAR
jgi:hypothetical protein